MFAVIQNPEFVAKTARLLKAHASKKKKTFVCKKEKILNNFAGVQKS